jgi:hypothetical protein
MRVRADRIWDCSGVASWDCASKDLLDSPWRKAQHRQEKRQRPRWREGDRLYRRHSRTNGHGFPARLGLQRLAQPQGASRANSGGNPCPGRSASRRTRTPLGRAGDCLRGRRADLVDNPASQVIARPQGRLSRVPGPYLPRLTEPGQGAPVWSALWGRAWPETAPRRRSERWRPALNLSLATHTPQLRLVAFVGPGSRR